MNNTYHGDFTQKEIDKLEQFSGYTFWKILNEWEKVEVYGKHWSWDNSQRIHSYSGVDGIWRTLAIDGMANGTRRHFFG